MHYQTPQSLEEAMSLAIYGGYLFARMKNETLFSFTTVISSLSCPWNVTNVPWSYAGAPQTCVFTMEVRTIESLIARA